MMGVLRHIESRRAVVLAAHSVAGRASNCVVHLGHVKASNTHAALRWTGERWEVRDLASLNHTFVNGVRAMPAENVALERGAELRFGGDTEIWALEDASGPVVVASLLTTDVVRAATDGVLPLPDEEKALVLVVRDGTGQWFVETPEEGRRPAKDGELIVVAGQTWQLTVPPFSPIQGTYTEPATTHVASFTLRFHESVDGEHVSVDLLDEGKVRPLGERTCFDMLLHLARERRKDAADAKLPEADQGWLFVSDLIHDLNVTEQHLNVMIFRVRAVFAESSVAGAESIVERRRRQIRIGMESGRLVVG
jgi:hypothetical protein